MTRLECLHARSEAQGRGVVLDVISEEGGDHVVGMVVQRLQPHSAGIAGLPSSSSQVLRLQLALEEAVRGSLVGDISRLCSDWFHHYVAEASSLMP